MENKMAVMPIPKLILSLSAPIVVSMVIQSIYNIVDSMYVARYSEAALTSVALVFPVQMVVAAAYIGMETGISALVGRRLGEKNLKGAVKVVEQGAVIALAIYVGVLIASLMFGASYYGQFSGSRPVIDGAVVYSRIVMVFSFGIIVSHWGKGMMQGSGDMLRPMLSQLLGAVLNLILDPIFIFGYFGLPAMGVKGAAIATVIGQTTSLIYVLAYMFSGSNRLRPTLTRIKIEKQVQKELLKISIPSALMQGIGSVMVAGLNLILADFGAVAIAVMGIYFKVQSLIFMPMIGVAIGVMPVLAYNYGAKNFSRLRKTMQFSLCITTLYMIGCMIFVQLFPHTFIGLFDPSDEMLSIGIEAFRRLSLFYPFVSMPILFSTAFQAYGKSSISVMLSVSRQLLILLPAAYLLALVGDLNKVWFAFLIAEVIGAVGGGFLFVHYFRLSADQMQLPA